MHRQSETNDQLWYWRWDCKMTAVPGKKWIFKTPLLGAFSYLNQLLFGPWFTCYQIKHSLHTAEQLYEVGFWSANIFSALATEPVTIFIGDWIKFKISSEGVDLSWACSCPLYIRHFSVDTAYHLATGLKDPICIDCTPLSLRGGSVNWITPPPGWPDGHSSHVDNLCTSKILFILFSDLLIFTSLAEGIQLVPYMMENPNQLSWREVTTKSSLSLLLLIKH